MCSKNCRPGWRDVFLIFILKWISLENLFLGIKIINDTKNCPPKVSTIQIHPSSQLQCVPLSNGIIVIPPQLPGNRFDTLEALPDWYHFQFRHLDFKWEGWDGFLLQPTIFFSLPTYKRWIFNDSYCFFERKYERKKKQ